MEINSRMSSILYLILASKGRISMESLMEETGVSKRALYYDLNKINVCLTDSGVGPISLEDGECMIRDEERRNRKHTGIAGYTSGIQKSENDR